MNTNRIAVVGGGASGIVAAIKAAESGADVVLFELNDSLGRKILSTGNGKCNISNVNAEGVEEVKGFFHSLGILFREDEGRLYPLSEQARSVRDILVAKVDSLGIEVRLDTPVEKLSYDDLSFYITSEDGKRICEFDKVVIATGGKAAPHLGASDNGYRFARELGHKVISPLPALVPFEYMNKNKYASLKGVRAKAKSELLAGDNVIASSEGEVQFTDYGLSGICIFDLSSYIRDIDKNNMSIRLDLAPEYSLEEIQEIFKASGNLEGILNSKLIGFLKNPEEVKSWSLKVSGTKGWKEAQVTSGGVSLEEVNLDTMESKLVPGLFFAGEVLDKDFKCGGFNLDFAWITGLKAGVNANA